MQKLLLVFFLFSCQMLCAQRGFLNVKKHGFKKVRSFEEGSPIKFQTKNGDLVFGTLALVKNDSIFVNGYWFAVADIQKIILKQKADRPFDYKTFLWTTAGVALSTAGMTFANWTDFGTALGYSAGIGYGNFLIRYFPKFKRKKYKIGKKFSLQTLDLHF